MNDRPFDSLTEAEQDAISRVLHPCPDCGETFQVPASDGSIFCSTGGCERSRESIEEWGYADMPAQEDKS